MLIYLFCLAKDEQTRTTNDRDYAGRREPRTRHNTTPTPCRLPTPSLASRAAVSPGAATQTSRATTTTPPTAHDEPPPTDIHTSNDVCVFVRGPSTLLQPTRACAGSGGGWARAFRRVRWGSQMRTLIPSQADTTSRDGSMWSAPHPPADHDARNGLGAASELRRCPGDSPDPTTRNKALERRMSSSTTPTRLLQRTPEVLSRIPARKGE